MDQDNKLINKLTKYCSSGIYYKVTNLFHNHSAELPKEGKLYNAAVNGALLQQKETAILQCLINFLISIDDEAAKQHIARLGNEIAKRNQYFIERMAARDTAKAANLAEITAKNDAKRAHNFTLLAPPIVTVTIATKARQDADPAPST